MRFLCVLLLVASAAALAAAGKAQSEEPELPTPVLVNYTGTGEIKFVQQVGRLDDSALRQRLGSYAVTVGKVSTKVSRKCAFPLNQIYFTEDSTRKVRDMWLGSYSYNSYVFGANNGAGGRNGPGKGGAACTNPPQWGTAFPVTARCSSIPPPFEQGMTQWALYNVFINKTADTYGAITFVTKIKFYYAADGGVERQELTVRYWSPTKGFLNTFDLAAGRELSALTGTKATLFEAPEGLVIGNQITAQCKRGSRTDPVGNIIRMKKACAIAPSWYPQDKVFPNTYQSELYGYNCTKR